VKAELALIFNFESMNKRTNERTNGTERNEQTKERTNE